MENENEFFFMNSIINHTWKVANVVIYCDTRTDVHTYTQTHIEKNVYIYIIIDINCGNDTKNQRYYKNQFGSNNFSRNNLLQYKVTYKCFIDFGCRVNYYISDNH